MLWRGLLMGLADAVPGISGGTVAFLLRIHTRLVAAIAGLDVGLMRSLWKRDWDTLRQRDIGFLLLLGSGIVLGLILGAITLAEWVLPRYPIASMAVLFGLVAYSIRLPARHVAWNPPRIGWALVAGVAAFAITVIAGWQAPSALWFLPIAGAIAACAMILPGISGAYLLLLMGLYEPVLSAVAHLDFTVVALVGVGAIVGLLVFSRGLHWMLQHRTDATHAVLVGLLAGSVLRLWPWRSEPGFAHGAPAIPGTAWPVALVLLGVIGAWYLDIRVQKPKGA